MRYFHLLLSVFFAFSCRSQSDSYVLSTQSFNDKIIATPDGIVLDVRTPGEFQKGFIPKAVNLDYNDDQFASQIGKLDQQKTYFIYCLSGGRSASAAAYMREQGFKQVFELKGGVMAWQKEGMSLTNQQAASETTDKISMAQYQQLIASDQVVLVDFYAPWCGPCKQMMPILEDLSETYKGKATIIRINVDENPALQKAQKIDEIPYFKLYRKGQEAGNFIGQLDRASFIRILDGK